MSLVIEAKKYLEKIRTLEEAGSQHSSLLILRHLAFQPIGRNSINIMVFLGSIETE